MTNFVFACKTTLQINFEACLVYRVRTASWACDLMLAVHTESFNMHAVTSLLHHVNTSSRANQPCAGDGIGDFSHTWLISLLRLPFFLNFFYFYRENSSCILQWLEVLGWKWQTIQIRGSRDGCVVVWCAHLNHRRDFRHVQPLSCTLILFLLSRRIIHWC